MTFAEKLERYAELAVKAGLDLQPGQELMIEAQLEAAPFVRRVAAQAWQAGAKDVTVYWADEDLTRMYYLNGRPELFTQYPDWRALQLNGLAERGGAFLSIRSGDPAALAGVDPARVAAAGKASHAALSLIHIFFITFNEETGLQTPRDKSFPYQSVGIAKLKNGTIIGGVRHQFRDTATGIEARTLVEFPAICPKIVLREHQKHLAAEWSGWIQWAIEHQ